MIADLIRETRSCRRFRQNERIEIAFLQDLVDLARCSASAGNLQPLKYILCADPARNAEIFSCLGWAAYLTDWTGPEAGERPAAWKPCWARPISGWILDDFDAKPKMNGYSFIDVSLRDQGNTGPAGTVEPFSDCGGRHGQRCRANTPRPPVT